MAKVIPGGIRTRIESARKKLKDLEARKHEIDREKEVLNRYIQACQFIQATERGGARGMTIPRMAKPLKAPPRALPGGRFKGMKIAEATEILLKRAGTPLQVSEMVKRLRAGGIKITSKVPGASVTAALRRHPTKFKMTKPGFYTFVKK